MHIQHTLFQSVAIHTFKGQRKITNWWTDKCWPPSNFSPTSLSLPLTLAVHDVVGIIDLHLFSGISFQYALLLFRNMYIVSFLRFDSLFLFHHIM